MLTKTGDMARPYRSIGRGQKAQSVTSNESRLTSRRAPSTRRQSAADLELQDWVVQHLQLSSPKLTQKDLDRISTLASVYCRINNLKGILATKYKQDDIFKKRNKSENSNRPMTAAKSSGGVTKDENTLPPDKPTSNIRQDATDHDDVVKTEQDDDMQDVGETRPRTAKSQSDLTPVETADPDNQQLPASSKPPLHELIHVTSKEFEPTPGCSKDPDHQPVPASPKPPADDPKPGTSKEFEPTPGCSKDPDHQPVPASPKPSADDPKPGTSKEFEPTPGCSKDPDVPVRSFSKTSRKSHLSTSSSKSTKSERISITSDYVDPFFRRARSTDLAPVLQDESLPPRRRGPATHVPTSHEEEKEEEDPSKVNVDSDLMEMALFIHLAMRKRTRALRAMIDAQ